MRRPVRRLVLLALLAVAAGLLLALEYPSRAEALALGGQRATLSGYQRFRNLVLGPPRVGLQIGHLAAAAHPQELARLRYSTGGVGGGLREVDVNQAVATALAARLELLGIVVDLLPATVGPRYRADLVVSIHADSSTDTARRGYKSAVFRRPRNRFDERLKTVIDSAYLSGSRLHDDDSNVSGDMLEYYAFNPRYRHSLAPATPAVIVELGYLSNPGDRRLLGQPDTVAGLLESGITMFLAERGRLPPP